MEEVLEEVLLNAFAVQPKAVSHAWLSGAGVYLAANAQH